MICSKCGRINVSGVRECSYCNTRLAEDLQVVELKHFTGQKININEQYFEKSMEFDRSRFENINKTDNSSTDSVPRQVQTKKIPVRKPIAVNKVSFEDGFDMADMTLPSYEKNVADSVITKGEREALRNTALLAVILAVVIDAVLLVCMLTYFKGFAEKIVTVDSEVVSQSVESTQNEDIININGKNIVV